MVYYIKSKQNITSFTATEKHPFYVREKPENGIHKQINIHITNQNGKEHKT